MLDHLFVTLLSSHSHGVRQVLRFDHVKHPIAVQPSLEGVLRTVMHVDVGRTTNWVEDLYFENLS